MYDYLYETDTTSTRLSQRNGGNVGMKVRCSIAELENNDLIFIMS